MPSITEEVEEGREFELDEMIERKEEEIKKLSQEIEEERDRARMRKMEFNTKKKSLYSTRTGDSRGGNRRKERVVPKHETRCKCYKRKTGSVREGMGEELSSDFDKH